MTFTPATDADAAARAEAEAGVEAIEVALVALVRQVSSARTWRRLAAASDTPLDRAHYQVLRAVVENAPVRATDLADLVGVDQSTMSRHIKQLERSGYVARIPDPDDRRASTVSITAHGREVMARVRNARHDWIAGTLAGWSPDDRAQLTPLLVRLAHDFTETSRP